MLLPFYKDFNDKKIWFKDSSHYTDNKIQDISQFNRWYADFSKPYNTGKKYEYFFRGMKEAKYKLFNSAQREWTVNHMSQWSSHINYLDFLKSLIEEVKKKKLFRKVLEYHQIDYGTEADFPILSILQHYGAPTPLMDFSYNLDVALYFATEDVNTIQASDDLSGYFSVYVIKKEKQHSLQNIFTYSDGKFPQLTNFKANKFEENSFTNFVCYISDFEENNQDISVTKTDIPFQKETRRRRPVTTYYNQNIIPQEGLFIFNPYPDRAIEECFSPESRNNPDFELSKDIGGDEPLAPFLCYNIRKDLADYIRRKIGFNDVDKHYIYPELIDFCKKAKETVFNNCCK